MYALLDMNIHHLPERDAAQLYTMNVSCLATSHQDGWLLQLPTWPDAVANLEQFVLDRRLTRAVVQVFRFAMALDAVWLHLHADGVTYPAEPTEVRIDLPHVYAARGDNRPHEDATDVNAWCTFATWLSGKGDFQHIHDFRNYSEADRKLLNNRIARHKILGWRVDWPPALGHIPQLVCTLPGLPLYAW